MNHNVVQFMMKVRMQFSTIAEQRAKYSPIPEHKRDIEPTIFSSIFIFYCLICKVEKTGSSLCLIVDINGRALNALPFYSLTSSGANLWTAWAQ